MPSTTATWGLRGMIEPSSRKYAGLVPHSSGSCERNYFISRGKERAEIKWY